MTEVRSTELYVNTEGLYPNDQGTQFTRFKVDFLEAPFGVGDDERLKIIPTSAFIAKNWDDLNETNRYVRIFVGASSTIFNPIDEIVSIPAGDFVTHESLAAAFGTAVSNVLNDNLADVITVASSVPEMGQFAATTVQATGSITPVGATNIFRPILNIRLTLSAGTAWAAADYPILQCLSLDPNTSLELLGSGVAVPLLRDQQNNDSYVLLGGRRITTFESGAVASTPSIATSSFNYDNPAGNTDRLNITSPWRMNYQINTLPYIYLNCQQTLNQGTTNLQEFNGVNLTKGMIHADCVGKLRRVYSRENYGEISYELESGRDFFSPIGTRYLSNLVLSLQDHKGRFISHVQGQDTVGNAMISMSLKIEIDKDPNVVINRAQLPPPDNTNVPAFGKLNIGGPDFA
tara:strand:- start:141 stop:1352 length:1212 start_codon:yes stop_codon:yes gene_type:complete